MIYQTVSSKFWDNNKSQEFSHSVINKLSFTFAKDNKNTVFI